jgi:hypothetical protein
MKSALLALAVTFLVAACGGGSGGATPAPTQDLSSLDPCAVVEPALVEGLVGPFLQSPAKLTVETTGAPSCNYTGAQAMVSIIFSTDIATPEEFANDKEAAGDEGGFMVRDLGDDAFYVLRPAAFDGGILTVLDGTQVFTVGVQIIPNTQTQPMPDAQFQPTAVAIGQAVLDGLAAR